MNWVFRIVRFFFSRTPILKAVDGHKSEIGFVLMLLGLIADVLAQAALLFPSCTWCGSVSELIRQILGQLAPYLLDLGIVVMSAGVLDNTAKEKLAK